MLENACSTPDSNRDVRPTFATPAVKIVDVSKVCECGRSVDGIMFRDAPRYKRCDRR